jgi:hypothetical protein
MLLQSNKDAIWEFGEMTEKAAEESSLASLFVIGGEALAQKLENVSDKESAAEALFILGSGCVLSTGANGEVTDIRGQIGMMSIYAAYSLIK